MQGDIDDENLAGIIPRMVNQIFDHIDFSTDDIQFEIKVGIVEIYCEKVQDLLDCDYNLPKLKEVREMVNKSEKYFYIQGLKEINLG